MDIKHVLSGVLPPGYFLWYCKCSRVGNYDVIIIWPQSRWSVPRVVDKGHSQNICRHFPRHGIDILRAMFLMIYQLISESPEHFGGVQVESYESQRERDREWLKFYSWIKIPSLIVGANQWSAFSRFFIFSLSISSVFLLSRKFGADKLSSQLPAILYLYA